MIELHNHTPHPIEIRLADCAPIVLPSEPPVPRLPESQPTGHAIQSRWGPIPLTASTTTETVTDLPRPRSDTYLIVARLIADALPDRTDLVFPDNVIRDHDGNVIACHTLGTHHPPAAPPSD